MAADDCAPTYLDIDTHDISPGIVHECDKLEFTHFKLATPLLGSPFGRAVERSETERVFGTIPPKNVDHCLRQCDFFKITEPSQSRLSPCQLSQRESLDRYKQQFIVPSAEGYLVSCILYLVSCILYLVSHISYLISPISYLTWRCYLACSCYPCEVCFRDH